MPTNIPDRAKTMKHKSVALVLALVLGACVMGQSHGPTRDDAKVKSEVEAAFETLVNATRSGDHDLYFSLFDAESFTALTANGSILSSFEAFKQIYEPQLGAIESYKTLNFDPVHIQVIDPTHAILTNEYTADVVLTSGALVSASGAGTQVWSKSTGAWKLVHISDALKPE